MRYVKSIISFALVFCFLLLGCIGVSAADLETLTVPDPTVGVLDPSSTENTVDVLDSLDSDTPIFFSLSSSELSGLVSFTVDSNLGEITLYLPDGVSSGSFRVSDGRLFNVTNSTIYLFSPDLPEYTFSASRFAPVYYRNTSGSYNSVELTGVSIVSRTYSFDESIPYVMVFCLVFIVFSQLWRRVHD